MKNKYSICKMKNKYFRHTNLRLIVYLLFVLCGIFLLCTIFATDISLVNGLVMGKVHWFHLTMVFLTACCLVATILKRPEKTFEFSVADGLVLVLAAIVAVTYNWQMNPEPEKMLFGGQLVISWFVLRFIFTGWPLLRVFFLMGVCRDRID